jgi:hypothetical protein
MLTPIETRRAGPAEDDCPVCGLPVERGRRIALVRSDRLGHVWVHVRHVAEVQADDGLPRSTDSSGATSA